MIGKYIQSPWDPIPDAPCMVYFNTPYIECLGMGFPTDHRGQYHEFFWSFGNVDAERGGDRPTVGVVTWHRLVPAFGEKRFRGPMLLSLKQTASLPLKIGKIFQKKKTNSPKPSMATFRAGKRFTRNQEWTPRQHSKPLADIP